MGSRGSAIMLIYLAMLCSCGERPGTAPSQREPSAEQRAILEEFETVAGRLEKSSNPYLGKGQLAAIEARLRSSESPKEKAQEWLQMCFQRLRIGEIEMAKQAVDHAFKEVQAAEDPRLEFLALKVRTMVSLREAETSNCIRNHNRECCIFPLAAGGIHRISDPARNAKRDLLEALKRSPSDLMLQWLLNIVAMALDEYPGGVPEQFRIPERYFDPALTSEIRVFTDVAPKLGLDSLDLAGGVVVEDFDGDGFLDIVTSTSDPRESLRFYRNAGDGTFQESTAGSGLEVQLGGLNLIGGDYDNDGDVDLLVLRGAWLEDDGRIRNSLLRNNGATEAGDGSKVTFTDVTTDAGLAERAWPSQTAAWGDFDNDGDLDLFVGNESRIEATPGQGDHPCQLFQNDGTGRFTDIAPAAGVTNDRFCKGVTVGDYDNDGDLDLYVSNVGWNRLYRNDGGMSFTDVAVQSGVRGFQGYNFAPWFFDVNNDGHLDLFVGAYKAELPDFMADARGLPHDAVPPNLYLNLGNGTFRDIASEAGLSHPYLPMGANFGDVDNDGFLDIYLATGESKLEILTPNVLLRNVGGKRFENATYAARLGHLQKGHGVAFADFDHDGDQDLFNQLGGFFPADQFHNALFLNPGNAHHYLVIQCVGAVTNRPAIGARITVTVEDAQGNSREIHRAVGSVSSFGGSPLQQEIGLGDAAAVTGVVVHWPASRQTQQFEEVALDSAIRITEGARNFQNIVRRRIEF